MEVLICIQNILLVLLCQLVISNLNMLTGLPCLRWLCATDVACWFFRDLLRNLDGAAGSNDTGAGILLRERNISKDGWTELDHRGCN